MGTGGERESPRGGQCVGKWGRFGILFPRFFWLLFDHAKSNIKDLLDKQKKVRKKIISLCTFPLIEKYQKIKAAIRLDECRLSVVDFRFYLR